MHRFTITRNVWILSVISLLTDVASEMLYPVMPVYLESIGFSVVFIGVLEGFAEATAGFSKGFFGQLSDSSGKRRPFIQIGYLLSALSKPMMVFSTISPWVFFVRFLDRIGKGVRTAARDALLSEEASIESKGKIFGFHRALDTTGAIVGPLIALLYLYLFPHLGYEVLFVLAFIPGLLAVLLTSFIRERHKGQLIKGAKLKALDFLNYWYRSSPDYRRLTLGLFVFAVANSSDVLLLLKVKEAGLGDLKVIGVYVFYNVVFALSAYPFGVLADKFGMKRVLVGGLILFSVVYIGIAFVNTISGFLVLFMVYGLYAAATEGVAKAWVTNLCRPEETATAVGLYTAVQSIGSLIASSLAGLLWYFAGPSTSFVVSGLIAIAVAGFFSFTFRGRYKNFS